MKAASWRITRTVNTLIISFVITGKATITESIAAAELMTKIGLDYFHEGIWALIARGHR